MSKKVYENTCCSV